jgi:parallel beta-helix repeat protein
MGSTFTAQGSSFQVFIPLALVLSWGFGHSVLGQGSLTPPGPPGLAFKTLDQLEPRTPISALPFTIAQPGSYYLTTNLTGEVGVTNGITIQASGVALDLMGFELRGGTGIGVYVPSPRTNVTIRNGSVHGWTFTGILAVNASNSRLEDLRAALNGGGGMQIGRGSIVRGCQSSHNGGRGIDVDRDSIVSACTAVSNGAVGIGGGESTSVFDCVAVSNGMHGIQVFAGSTVIGCTASSNADIGIRATGMIRGCTTIGNGGAGIYGRDYSTVMDCTTHRNLGDAILLDDDCLALRNHCDSNGDVPPFMNAGIHALGNRNRIDSNKITDNDLGIRAEGTGNLIIRNTAGSNATNYVIIGNNKVGVIVAAPDSAAISGSTGGAGVGTTDPWANLSY